VSRCIYNNVGCRMIKSIGKMDIEG
jgi:hypothetical protein